MTHVIYFESESLKSLADNINAYLTGDNVMLRQFMFHPIVRFSQKSTVLSESSYTSTQPVPVIVFCFIGICERFDE